MTPKACKYCKYWLPEKNMIFIKGQISKEATISQMMGNKIVGGYCHRKKPKEFREPYSVCGHFSESNLDKNIINEKIKKPHVIKQRNNIDQK